MTLDFLLAVSFVGILATYGLLTMALWAGRIGLPKLDFATAMTKFTYGDSYNGDPPFLMGNFVVYMNGIFFALLYATVVEAYLPGTALIKGTIYGIILWFVSCVFYVPVFLREGVFLSKIHKNAWMTSLMVHVVWGLIVGWLSPTI